MSGYLIVGLGNPGTKYEKTRHNLGFMVVEALAEKHGLNFKREWRLQGSVASGNVGEKKVFLLKPKTYMNLSGNAVRKALNYHKLLSTQLLVVVDDYYLPYGSFRLRGEGGTGGHNGLKSIEACLGTQNYPRLRMGVGPKENLPEDRKIVLEEYVLSNFTPEEQRELPPFITKGVLVIEEWLKMGENAASSLAGNLSQLG